ncbi:hypothetical protein CapIbe_000870 [Capra ibex]
MATTTGRRAGMVRMRTPQCPRLGRGGWGWRWWLLGFRLGRPAPVPGGPRGAQASRLELRWVTARMLAGTTEGGGAGHADLPPRGGCGRAPGWAADGGLGPGGCGERDGNMFAFGAEGPRGKRAARWLHHLGSRRVARQMLAFREPDVDQQVSNGKKQQGKTTTQSLQGLRTWRRKPKPATLVTGDPGDLGTGSFRRRVRMRPSFLLPSFSSLPSSQ